ncbi:MAG: peptidase inhibitor family I36 protein [Terracidiphilus sp.]|nr:peptidase inhibitor family I36 protein [Terracidiphilus sp.]
MRSRFARFAVLLLLCAASLPAFAQYQWGRSRPPQSGACFYRDSGFRGDYFCLKDGERWPSMPPGFNDVISSIRVFGGARLRVFADDNFNGISALINRDVFDLGNFRIPEDPGRSWNDRISSIAVFRDHDQWERQDRGRGQPPYQAPPSYQNQQPYPNQPSYPNQQPRPLPQGAGACFYLDADFRGASFCMKDGERQPVLPPGFNDAISSIRVFGGARVRVFVDGNYANASIVIDHDVNNLQGLPQGDRPFRNWNDCISSIVVFRGHDDWDRRDRNQGPPRY